MTTTVSVYPNPGTGLKCEVTVTTKGQHGAADRHDVTFPESGVPATFYVHDAASVKVAEVPDVLPVEVQGDRL